jgi:ribosomal protein S20
MAKTKLEILTAQKNAIESSSPTRSEKIKDLNAIVHVGSEKRKSLTECTNTIKDTINTSNNNSMKSAVRPFAKRISRSIEKGVSKLITGQDYNAINDTFSSNNDVLDTSCFSKKNEVLHVENCNLLSCDHKHGNDQTDLPQTNVDPNDSFSPLSNDVIKSENNKKELHLFIEDAIRELLKARRILRCSYVYGYYLDTFGHQKFIFEFIQTEFEECTENLSQIIARPHLKTPKTKIIRLTNILKRKRIEFIDTITRGLNSFNDTPPALKKYSRQRWKYLLKDNIQNDDEFKNTIALSLKELNPKNPWIIDKKGRHTNFLALLDDWPELENELDSILIPSKDKKGLCANWNCGNVRAVNTLSGSLCNYCSIKCMRNDHNNYLEQKKNLNKRQESKTSTSKTLQTTNIDKCESARSSTTHANKKTASCYLKPKKKLLGIYDESEKTSSFYLSEKSLKSAESDEFDEKSEINSRIALI